MTSTLSNSSLILFSTLKKSALALFLTVLFLGIQPSSSTAQSVPPAVCPADIVQDKDSGTCTSRVYFDVSGDGDNVIYTLLSGSQVFPGRPFPVGSTKVTKLILDQNGEPVSSCVFYVTVLDKEAPAITNCPGNLFVNNTPDACGATVYFTAPTVYKRCTTQQKVFEFTGQPTSFIVPAGVTSIDVDVKAAAGGHTFYNNTIYGYPGYGGEVMATIPVTPGQVLLLTVGGVGHDPSKDSAGKGGFNGGGNGGVEFDDYHRVFAASGGGGGASDIRIGAGSLADRIIVAGAGGSAGFTRPGGHGGDTTGANGGTINQGTPATGGTQTRGGFGGIWAPDTTYYGNNGSLGLGGDGNADSPSGGGGAGYYGGGGGAVSSGAGGSSYIYANATNVYSFQAAQAGNGLIVLSYNQPATLVQTNGLPSGSMYPVGETINTFTATDVSANKSQCTFKVTVADNQAPLVTAPANITVAAADQSCAAPNIVLGTPVTSDNCGIAGVTNNAPASFTSGTTTVTWTVTDIHGNTSTAIQTVTVTDTQKPVLTVPANQTFATAASSYSIPALTATDNCGVATVTYSVTGATTRSGTGSNASGSFNPGTSVITFTVTDVHGNVQTGSTTVNVTAAPAITVTIADVWAVSPWGNPNTIYLGFGPATLTLTVKATSGTSPFTFVWKKAGSNTVIGTSSSLVVSSEGTYTVTVTDKYGAVGTVSKIITVEDVRCGNNDDKVAICHTPSNDADKAKTICVSRNAVDKFLGNGNYLGNCTVAKSTEPEVVISLEKKVKVYPNPAVSQFTVSLNNFTASKVHVILLSASGIPVQYKVVELSGKSQNVVFNTHNLTKGLYLVQVISTQGIVTEKVVLQ